MLTSSADDSHRSVAMRLLLLPFLSASAAFRVPLAHGGAAVWAPRQLRRVARPLLSSADDRDEKTKSEDDALAAAFAARLEAEGGATNFKIKTTLTGAVDSVKDGARGLASGAAESASVGADGLLNASAWQLVVGLLLATIVFAFLNAGLRAPPADDFTSDGSRLEFGQRAPRNPYLPEYGTQ